MNVDVQSNQRIPTFVLKATVAASMGGILFGYDMGNISAALPQLTEAFNLNLGQEEKVVSFLYIGCFMGATVGGYLCDKFGRKRMIIVTDVLFMIGATVLYSGLTFSTILFGRIFLGCAVAISGIADVAYLHEISPPQYRGAIVSCNEACISFGFLLSYLVGYIMAKNDPINGWRDMFALGSIIAALQLIFMLMMPESPVWLEEKGDTQGAELVLNQIYGSTIQNPPTNNNEIEDTNENNSTDEGEESELYSFDSIAEPPAQFEDSSENCSMQTIRTLYRQITIAAFLCTMQSWCGHPNVLNFAPELFVQFGFHSNGQELICTMLLGVVSESRQ